MLPTVPLVPAVQELWVAAHTPFTEALPTATVVDLVASGPTPFPQVNSYVVERVSVPVPLVTLPLTTGTEPNP